MDINTDTRLIGLIGNPVGHSISPLLHNTIYSALDMNYIYMAFDVEDDIVKRAVEGMDALSFTGFNVTIPHKQRVLPLLDDIDDEAKIIGAVNTVRIKGDRWIGYNTDGMGFINGLKRLNFDVDGRDVAILGAGGAARAISVYLLKEGASRIYILNRTRKRGVALARQLNQKLELGIVTAINRAELDKLDIDLLVNTTSVGMHPEIEENPIEGFSFDPKTIVVDIIYNPKETKLLQLAKSHGCTIQNGMPMLIGQALSAIEIWTGKEITYNQFKDIVKNDDLLNNL